MPLKSVFEENTVETCIETSVLVKMSCHLMYYEVI